MLTRYRFKVYFSSTFNIIDACIVIITLLVTMIYTFTELTGASLIPRYLNTPGSYSAPSMGQFAGMCSHVRVCVLTCVCVLRVVTFLRALRIVILVRLFRLASQKKELEKVTRRMVSSVTTTVAPTGQTVLECCSLGVPCENPDEFLT